MAEPRIQFTKADYDRLPEDLRVELIDGELLKMAFPTVRHQQIAKRLFVALMEQVGIERVLFGPVGFVVDDANVLAPDLVVFFEGALPDSAARDLSEAALVVEVLSPSTAARDRRTKTDLYLGAGVGEVWLVDGGQRTIELRTVDGRRVAGGEEMAASAAIEGLVVRVAEFF